METRKQDPDAIAEEAVGQRHGEPPPYAVNQKAEMSQEEMARRLSEPAGPRASIPEKTAEAVGERVGDAYADPGSARNLPGKIARRAGPHERSGAVRQVPELVPRYNIAPTQLSPVVVAAEKLRTVRLARWGLVPPWSRDLSLGARMINALAEEIEDKPVFRSAFHGQRCLVPANGYYE